MQAYAVEFMLLGITLCKPPHRAAMTEMRA